MNLDIDPITPQKEAPPPLPRRLVHAKSIEEPIKKGLIAAGTHVAYNLQAFWDNDDTKCEFEAVDNRLIFNFSKLPRPYFSLSWSLDDHEASLLTKSREVSLSAHKICTLTDRPINSKIYGKLVHFKVKTETAYSTNLQKFRGRQLVGFSLSKAEVEFTHANRVWLALIISNPRTRNFVFEDLQFIVQNRLSL